MSSPALYASQRLTDFAAEKNKKGNLLARTGKNRARPDKKLSSKRTLSKDEKKLTLMSYYKVLTRLASDNLGSLLHFLSFRKIPIFFGGPPSELGEVEG